MANIILLILLENYFNSLIKNQPNLLCGVKGQLSSLHHNLKSIIDKFTKNNVMKSNRDKDMKTVVDQIQKVAVEVEDVIDTYLAKVLIMRSQMMGNPPGRLIHLISNKKVFRDAAFKTRSIADDILKRINDAEATNGTGEAASSAAAAQVRQLLPRNEFVEEYYVVGFDNDTESLINQLTDLKNLQRTVISIIGMGGLGKTTLAKKIYNKIYNDYCNNDSKKIYDKKCVAWVYVSQGYNRRKFFLDLLKCFDYNYKNLSDEDLAPRVRDHLTGKRYFVVMDEIWQTQVWEEVGEAFPDDSNGSRVLITSRHKEIASHASPGAPPFLLSFLDNDASWELFCANEELKFLKEENCPSNLKNLGKQFVEGCKGLPLSIIDLGEVLAKEGKTYQTWSKFFSNDTDGYSKRKSDWCLYHMAQSYNHLPQHLKPCFLYLGVFPKDSEIQTRVLIQLWIAEGFVQAQTLNSVAEDAVAKSYLEELVNRSLIQVTSRRSDGSAKTCCIHSVIRNFCLTESLQENFLEVQQEDDLALRGKDLDVQSKDHDPASGDKPPRNTESNLQQRKNLVEIQSEGDPASSPKPPRLARSNLRQKNNLGEIQSGDSDSSSCVTKPRRLSVHCNSLSYYITWNTSDRSSARSLLYFCGQKQMEFDNKKWVWLHRGLKFVRVLSLFNINIKSGFDLSGIENLIFLSCFKISGTGSITKLPDSMCNLRFLETLDLGVQVSDQLWPKNLWRMKQLRCLRSLPMKFAKPDEKKELGNYEYGRFNLQVLSELYIDKETANFLANSKFPNLLDLGIFRSFGEVFDQSEMTKVLVSLVNLQNLQRLRITGFMKCDPRPYILASTLTRVKLYDSYVDSNLLRSLGNLPNLLALALKKIDCATDPIRMVGNFPRLQVFKMIGFDVQKWELEKDIRGRDAMPKLQHLVILGNRKMKALPNELWCREDLRLVHMSKISESLKNSFHELECFTEERNLESPAEAGNSRYLQGRVFLNKNNKCKVLIQTFYEQEAKGEISTQGVDDILTHASGTEDYKGRVKSKESYVTPSRYFTTPINEKKSTAVDEELEKMRHKHAFLEQSLATLVSQMKEMQKQSSASQSVAPNLGTPHECNDFGTPSPGHSTPIGDPSPRNVASFGEPSSIPQDIGKKCSLAVNSRDNIVAWGYVMPSTPTNLYHGVALGNDNVRIMIETITNPLALLPVRSFEMATMGEAWGSFCLWPKSLVIYPEEDEERARNSSKGKAIFDGSASHRNLDLTSVDLLLDRVASKASDYCFMINMDFRIFNDNYILAMPKEEIIHFCRMEMVAAESICVYIRYLYEYLRRARKDDRFCFIHPQLISDHSAIPKKDAIRTLATRWASGIARSRWFMPYWSYGHWMLGVVDIHSGVVYFLDSLNHGVRKPFEMLIDGTYAEFRKNSHSTPDECKKLAWVPAKAPQQRGNIECGYFLMMFMKDIIERGDDVDIAKLYENVDTFTEQQVEEFRVEWCTYFVEHIK